MSAPLLFLLALPLGGAAAATPAALVQGDPQIEYLELEEARARSAETGLPIALVFRAVWCAACRELEGQTLPSDLVQSRGDDFHWVRVDVDRDATLTRSYGVDSTPHLIVEDAGGHRGGEARGFLTPDELVAFLDEAGPMAMDSSAEPLSVRSELLAELTWSPTGYRGHAICFSHVGYGPLDLPSQAPGQVLRLGLVPRTPSTLAEGDVEVQWTESLANIFAYREADYRLDYGTLNSTASIAYGLSDELQIEFEYSDLTRFDSVLDPITTAFHDAFGFGDAGRDQFSEGDNALYLAGIGAAADTSNETVGSISRDLGLTLQHNLTCGTEHLPAISYGATVRHHSGGKANLEGDNPWSFGLTGAASRRFGDDVYGYLGLGYTFHGMDRWENLTLRDEQAAGLLAFEWRYGADSSLVLQYLVSEGVAEDRDPFSKAAHEVGIGWKRELQPGLVLELGLIENAVVADNSPDFGLHFGLKRRF